MTADGMIVRPAEPAECATIVELALRVQAKLTGSGSLQIFGPLAPELVAAHIAAGHAHVLETASGVMGSVFVEPVTDERLAPFHRWRLDDLPAPIWFLSKLMIAPEDQGHGHGYILLEGAQAAAAARGAGTLVLDCWAGNDTLRAFYIRAGFRLHGVFPANGYSLAVFTWSPAGDR